MSYLLRIINQNLPQTETAKNHSLEGEDYDIIYKVSNRCVPEGTTPFEKALEDYFKELPQMPELKQKVVAIVYGKNRQHIINSDEVAYIVNDEGKTMERIYGQYNKY